MIGKRGQEWPRLRAVAAGRAIGLVMLLGSGLAQAQTATDPITGLARRPEVGGTYQQPDTNRPLIASSSDIEILRHRDFAGKPCLTFGGYARPFTTNQNLFDHVVAVENGCPKAIKLQLCYYKSTECLAVEVPGYARKETVLGTMPSQKDFRYEFREKF
jgi:hypothetical protein